MDGERKFCLSKVKFATCFTEDKSVQSKLVVLIQNVGEKAVNCVVFSELFLKDEQVVNIVENSVEIRLQ